ncbi:MAG: IS21 family transposase [Candidatus Paceibacterota bacterium]|jgi:transposase
MTITPDLTAQILRYHHAERWPAGTISTQLNVHRETVMRVLTQAGVAPIVPTQRPSGVTPYMPFIEQTLKQFPNLTASRLYTMVVERGYGGRPDHFRHIIARHRPRPTAQAYLRLRTLPGEQCQCDWGHFGHIKQGQAKRPLMAFVMVLSWSRRIFLRFFLGAHMENFLRGHVQAFESWGSVPRVTLYDNLKSAVLERKGQAIRFNPTLLALAAHYRFEPRPVAPARGNEKGRVERSIRYIRDNFFAARTFKDIDDLNAQADAWVAGAASQRRCPEDTKLSVQEAFELELPQLMELPATPFSCDELRAVSAGKTPYVRFDLNDYSIPHTHVQRSLTVSADLNVVRVLDGQQVLATHRRCWDKGEQVEVEAHMEELVQHKRAARAHRNADRLVHAVPQVQTLLGEAVKRGEPLARTANQLQELLDVHGRTQMAAAVADALSRGVPHPNAVRLALERQRQPQTPPPLGVALPEHVRVRDIAVRPHSLDGYDQLIGDQDDAND